MRPQMMNSALYKATNPSGSISVHSYPLPFTLRQDIIQSAITSMFIALGIIMGFAFVSAFYASFLVYERENNVKHQQASAMSKSRLQGDAALLAIPRGLGSLIVCLLLSHMCAVDFRDQRQRLLDLQSHLGCAAVPDPHVYVALFSRTGTVFPVNSCPILLFCNLLCLHIQGPQLRF